MKPTGYVKLHRSLLDNPIFFKDRTATYLFIALLMLADRHTGIYNGGRFRLSAITGIKPITCYKTLKRLQHETMVKLKVNRDYTEITVVNWSKYQNEETQSKRKVNPKETQSNTKQEERIENKEINITKVILEQKNDNLISKTFYEAVTSLKLPVQNHTTIRAKIKQMSKEASEDDIIAYLIFMRDQFADIDIEFNLWI